MLGGTEFRLRQGFARRQRLYAPPGRGRRHPLAKRGLLMNSLRIIDACTEEHFAAMSRIHARGWHAAYPGHVPDDYLRDVITEDHWIPFFREDYATGAVPGAAAL